MRSTIFSAALLLVCQAGMAQKSFINAGSMNESFGKSVTTKCAADATRWSIADGKVVRHYNNGFDYVLIDTAGLYIYTKTTVTTTPSAKNGPTTKTTTAAFFSKDACGEIYPLTYYAMKKCFKEYDGFVEELKKVQEKDLSMPAKEGNTTLANALYVQYVRNDKTAKAEKK